MASNRQAVQRLQEYFIMMSRREQLLVDLWSAGQRRMFLLQLKKKYAGKFLLVNYYNALIHT